MPEKAKLDALRPLDTGGDPVDPRHESVRTAAAELAGKLVWQPNTPASSLFRARVRVLRKAMRPVFAAMEAPPRPAEPEDVRWLRDHVRLLQGDLRALTEAARTIRRIPHVRDARGEIVPRVVAVAEGYLEATGWQFDLESFAVFCAGFQNQVVLDLKELWALVPALKLLLLEQIAARSRGGAQEQLGGAGTFVRSLIAIGHTNWKYALEPLILLDRILREDPAGAYPRMDFESRDLYRTRLAKIAAGSHKSELEVARAAVSLAQQAKLKTNLDPRVAVRESHVGFYLIDKGVRELEKIVSLRARLDYQVQSWMREHADEFFFPGIEILTLLILTATALVLTPPTLSPVLLLLTVLVLLLPCSQAAVQLMNLLVTSVLPAEPLPKLDFSDGIPEDCTTLVAIPTLLLNDAQVHRLVEELEVRYLGNHDANVHFALLSDLPDSREPAREDSPLIDLATDLIQELNARYKIRNQGSFLLLHRHRTYNPQERAWMGWERKRGKLMDLNQLLRGQFDSFPVKIGDLSVLARVCFVITLDSDTELPRGSAQRMVGTLAHPLNQAVIDPAKNIVTAGYGILQPRVGISVQSTSRSRLAAIYAGETGLDPYTRAVSDAYQDLYGEGIFTGKGIYEVRTVHRVLHGRFPRNALLSHDLIEGAYARAGLISDVEVIEDYPSHYSAYNRRKHRWLRGDWQITGWLFRTVKDESGASVTNPISLISRWKIFDNLRRSLVEPATFVMLLSGWLFSSSPWTWTLAAISILLFPAVCDFVVRSIKAVALEKPEEIREAGQGFFTALANAFLTFTFLGHQALVSLDAVGRALIRRAFTRRGLLEWETAAEVEAGHARRTPVDTYLNWMPLQAAVVGLLVWWLRPDALPAALPVLLLWGGSKLVAMWLNGAPQPGRTDISRNDTLFLRRSALYTWRYFAEHSTPEHNWLIPDNVQQEPASVAARLSPTNLGLLLNARQVACEFGYLTVPEFVEQTLLTLTSMEKLRKCRGHLLNWYDTRTLEALPPFFVSSVDSGNLLASLWTLRQGCHERLRQPVFQPCLLEGLLDPLRVLVDLHVFPRKSVARFERARKTGDWLQAVLSFPASLLQDAERNVEKSKDREQARRFLAIVREQLAAVQQAARSYAPWSLPEFAALRDDPALNLRLMDNLALGQLPTFLERLDRSLAQMSASGAAEWKLQCEQLRDALAVARVNIASLIDDLRRAAAQAEEFADQMDFAGLLDPHRRLLSVGMDAETEKLNAACYDLLASESRTALFVAIAKDDVPQESWFLLGRGHTLDQGRPVLLSWTGTMFEYLMPSLWMRSYPNTLLERSQSSAVHSQQAYALDYGVPWGISESGYFQLNDSGHYKYHAFGIPQLALHKPEFPALVISPYSTLLALPIDAAASLVNLQQMRDLGWLGSCGFFEAADYTAGRRRFRRRRFQLVRSWMAHHQGMVMLSLANFLQDGVVQRWFHSDRRVQATELLLHEKPVAHVPKSEVQHRVAIA